MTLGGQRREQEADARDAALLEAVDRAGRDADAEIAKEAGAADRPAGEKPQSPQGDAAPSEPSAAENTEPADRPEQ